MPDDAGGCNTGGPVCQPPVPLAASEVLAVELVDVELELIDMGLADVTSGEIEDTGVDTTLRVSAPPSVSLLDVPLTEAIMVEVKDVVLDHADHNCGDDDAGDDVDAALVDVSAAAIAVSGDVDVIATV